MARNYVKKTTRKATSPKKLQEACKLVNAGWALRAAARQANVHHQVLWKFVTKAKKKESDLANIHISAFKLSHASRRIFTDDQEDNIAAYCIQVSKMGYGLTIQKVRELAWEVAQKNNINVPENWQREKQAGIDWFHAFKKRHADKLSIRTPESCSIARAMAFNKLTVEKYFDKLEEVLSRHPSYQDGSRVYNLDETSTSTVQTIRKLVSPKGVKQVYQVKTSERGTSVTTCVIIGAHGIILPPVLIFPRKHFKSNMLINAYPGTLGLANEKGYNTKETFHDVMKHFIYCTKSSKENPTLLLLDNVETHFSTESLELAKKNGVIIFTFPPHCTHKLQPLDIGFFGPFKSYYDNAIHSFILSNPAVPVTIYHIAGFVCEALSRAATPANIISSFQKPGICPFNRNVFQDSDYIMASVTEQPDSNNLLTVFETATSEDLTINQDAVDESLNSKNSDELTDRLINSNSTNEKERSNGNSSFIGPEVVRGYPHAKPKNNNRKPKRKGKCMIATDTPEKEAILQREKEVKEKKQKAEERKRKRVAEQKRKKVQKRKKKAKSKGAFRSLTFDSSSEDELSPLLEPESDTSSTVNNVSVSIKSCASFTPLNRSPIEGDYVLVCFLKKNLIYFVGKIIKDKTNDGDLQISYMRKKPGFPTRFVFPNVPDIHSIQLSDIKAILPKPTFPAYVTRRQQSISVFDYDFNNVILG